MLDTYTPVYYNVITIKKEKRNLTMTTKYVLRRKLEYGNSSRWDFKKADVKDTFAEAKLKGQKVELTDICVNWQVVQRTIDEHDFEVEDIVVYDYEKEGKKG
jgi:hypothetical protein